MGLIEEDTQWPGSSHVGEGVLPVTHERWPVVVHGSHSQQQLGRVRNGRAVRSMPASVNPGVEDISLPL